MNTGEVAQLGDFGLAADITAVQQTGSTTEVRLSDLLAQITQPYTNRNCRLFLPGGHPLLHPARND